MDALQPVSPSSAPGKHGAILTWLLTEIPPKSAGGILAVALAMWVPVFLAVFFLQDWYPIWIGTLCTVLGSAAGFLSLAGLSRIRRAFRLAKTKVGKAAVALAILPLLAMAAISMYLGAVILVTTLRRH